MSIFYCHYHDRHEDSDFVGFNVFHDQEYCDEALEEIDSECRTCDLIKKMDNDLEIMKKWKA